MKIDTFGESWINLTREVTFLGKLVAKINLINFNLGLLYIS